MSFSSLAERQILKAQADGQMDNLEGEGKPLPERAPGSYTSAATMRIMAQAGAVPREIELKKEIEVQRQVVQKAKGSPSWKSEMAKLADLQCRHAIEQESRKRFFT
ncbi:hypothetical protein PsAD2_02110 [Pseudovibrio axinellae]|uniref:DnaJ homologue subfamily C member 28 conserved domain-containing protein n=1 Tax=Pseudovibrio axinellae TaxID=989403 RepID=A0A165YYT6_9HYPH|nr:DUF1992 domain-containing protein [Pseudovibrio axinellae]KZL19357.1 hypothetical protein PsAD2_02110 [Pseudovibrio axinellae]SEQ39892.1 protein of unknown function [Pseudovibrio axinellae]